MSGQRTEIAIVGGGLAGGLIALALRQKHPHMKVLLIECEEWLGGNHRWSWFDTDMDPSSAELLSPFDTHKWSQYHVRFPRYGRTLETPYRSLSSRSFDATLRKTLDPQTLLTNTRVIALDHGSVTLENGGTISARAVIDCRQAAPSSHLTGGWQVFQGHHIRTTKPHGLTKPLIMDACVEQHGAYRFLYVLPLAQHEIFVEDTYYTDNPQTDHDILTDRIEKYCALHSMHGETVGMEKGALPVITGGDFAAHLADIHIEGVVLAGSRGGFTHPLTGYSLPMAVKTASVIAENGQLPGDQLSAVIERLSLEHWRRMRPYRFLGKMLFGAATPKERYKIFQHFYRLDHQLIERFYSGRSTRMDFVKILSGKPPVPITRAIKSVILPGSPLTYCESTTQ